MTLEETVKHSREEVESTSDTLMYTPTPKGKAPAAQLTPGSSTASAVTPDSKCDYIVYTVKDRVTTEVVAVLIETKTTQHPKFIHAVAQVTSLVPLALVPSYGYSALNIFV